MLKRLSFFLLLCGLSIGSATESPGRLAVLGIENTANSHQAFVTNMPNMIVTELVQQTGEELVERSRIDSAMQVLGVEGSFSNMGSRKIGEWVGADRILLGSFSQIEGNYRLDLRVIEVRTGKIIAASQATMRSEVSNLVPTAVSNLASSLTPKYRDPYAPVDISQASNQGNRPLKKQGRLNIRHRITLSLLTEKSVPMQMVRIYLDRKLIGQSPIIKSVNDEYVLFDATADAGFHVLELEHGVVSRTGEWKRNLEIQPEPISIEVPAGGLTEVTYKMKVYTTYFKFEDFKIR